MSYPDPWGIQGELYMLCFNTPLGDPSRPRATAEEEWSFRSPLFTLQMKSLRIDGWVIETEPTLDTVLSVRMTTEERKKLGAMAGHRGIGTLARRYIMEGLQRDAHKGQGVEQPQGG